MANCVRPRLACKDRLHHLSFIVLILAAWQACARDARADSEAASPTPDRDRADKIHGAIGKGVRGLGDRLDLFFSDERVEAELQQSRLRIRPTLEWLEGGETDQSIPIRINIVLPRLERKWQLRFTSIEDQDDDLIPDRVDVLPGSPDSATLQDDAAEDPTSTFVTLNYTPVARAKRNISMSGGPKLRDGSIKLFTALRLRFSTRLEKWRPRLTQTVYFDGDVFGERTRLDFDRPLAGEILFRTTSTATYTETSDGFELVQTFLVRRFLGTGKALQTSVSAAGTTRPVTAVERYVAAVGYRQQVWKDWLLLSVRPEIRYPREAGFGPEPALILSLQATF